MDLWGQQHWGEYISQADEWVSSHYYYVLYFKNQMATVIVVQHNDNRYSIDKLT